MKYCITIVLTLIAMAVARGQEVIISGSDWTDKSYRMEGDWSIETDGTDYYVVLGDSFKTRRGPDLKIFVTSKQITSISKRDAAEEYSSLVAELDSNKGGQRYKVPSAVLWSGIKTILIHCERYSVVWGGFSI